MLFEVSKESIICEVLQARCIVGHDVCVPWEEVGDMAIAMLALVVAGDAAELGSSPVRGDGALVEPRHRRGVVGHVFECGVAHRVRARHELSLPEEPRLLEVAVRDGARGVVFGHELALNLRAERVAP